MSISIISAVAKNGVIGKGNDLPWNLPRDLKHFSSITRNHTVIMGYNTYKSIFSRLGKPLPDRHNMVIAPDVNINAPDCEMVRDFDAWVKKATALEEEIFVIGGAHTYAQFLPYAQRMYISYIKNDYEGDVFFPKWNPSHWTIIQKIDYQEFEFVLYQQAAK